MKKILVFLFCIFAFFSSTIIKSDELFAHVDKTYFLQGKVGERTLVLKIKCYYESPIRYLNYFFENNKTDQYLEGTLLGNAWQFNAVNKPEEEINLVIREEKDGSWKGFWREGANKKINLILTPIVINTQAPFYNYSVNKELDLYDAYKISLIQLNKIKTEKISKNFKLNWYLEKESNISFFRLENEEKKRILDSINNTLETIQLSLIQNYYHLNPNIKNVTIKAETTYFNEGLISFTILSNTVLKNQDASTRQQLFTLNLQNGKQIALEDLIWFDKKNAKPENNDIMSVYEYRKNVFAPKLFSILNELYPQQMQINDCDLNKVTTWAIPDFLLTKKGIQFSFSNSQKCNLMDWAIIPYEKLTQFFSKKFNLN